MNPKALVNRVAVLEDYLLNIVGMLPPGYTPLRRDAMERQRTPTLIPGNSSRIPPSAESYADACAVDGA